MSCLYDSFSHLQPDFSSRDLRDIICHYLKKNPTINGMSAKEYIHWEKGIPLQQYIKIMRRQSSWGGGIEIKCYCDIFKRNVLVQSQPNHKRIEFLSKRKTKVWDIIHWNGYHYTPIRTILVK